MYFLQNRSIFPPEDAIGQINLVLKFLEGLPQRTFCRSSRGSAHQIELYPPQTLYKQDKEITYIYLLLEGQVAQARREVDAGGHPRQIMRREVGPGTLLGSYDFLFDTVYRTRAKALEYCRVLAIKESAFNQLIYRFPDVRKKLAPLPLISRLRTIPVLSGLDTVAVGFVADAVEQLKFQPYQHVYRPGAADERIFLIDDGQVELSWDGGQKHWLGTGSVFAVLSPGSQALGAPGGRTMDHAGNLAHDDQPLRNSL